MNPLEQQLAHPFGDAIPAAAETLDVAPGIRWIRMPLPFALDHVNLYLLRDRFGGRDGWTLVDCGAATDATRALWQRAAAQSLDGLPIVRVLCTHMHPDHIGMADTLTDRFEAPLWMTPGEYAMARVLSAAGGRPEVDRTVAHFRRHGVDDPAVLGAATAHHFPSLVPSVPPAYVRLRADEPVVIGERRWQVIIGTGHSPEHASLYCADGPGGPLLLSGDMVLPRISTNVSVFDLEPEANPVEWFLDSLREYAPCDADTLVLPSHGRPFSRLHVRVRQLTDHHAERLEVLQAALRDRPLSAFEAVPVVFGRRFDTHQMIFALGEALAHLHALMYRGSARRHADADNVLRFSAG